MVVKAELSGCQEFLQGLTSPEPPTLPKLGPWLRYVFIVVDNVFKIRVAHHSLSMPSKYRVDSLGKLGTARFVDAASAGSTEFSEAIVNDLIAPFL